MGLYSSLCVDPGERLKMNPNQGHFALFKGYSGAGKSVAALSYPNAFVFDFDRKMPKIAEKHFPGKKIDYESFTDALLMAKKLQSFEQYCPYETLIFDSLTHLSSLALASVAKLKGESIMTILAQMQGNKKNVEMMSIDYYNAETRIIAFFLDAIKVLWLKNGNPKHIIVTAHIIEVESAPDLKTKVVTRTRSLLTAGRKAGAVVPTVFDDVYLFGHETSLGEDRPKRKIITESMGEDDAKCSYANVPQTIDFTNKSFYDILESYGVFKNLNVPESTEEKKDVFG